jgi:hypothetical protein
MSGTFRALLIGAEHYPRNRLPNGGAYLSLHGCVGDVGSVEALLRARIPPPSQGGPAHEVVTLLAPNQGTDQPGGDPATWPTADNIRAALDALATGAQPGDQVFIYYSGHGGRAVTAFQDLKGPGGFDEALVPIDIGGGPGIRAERYLRDVELARFLQRLAAKRDPAGDRRVTVTLVFDCCHAGGTTRGTGIALRTATGGTSAIDTTPMPAGALDPKGAAEAAAAWENLRSQAATRGAAPAVTWLPPSDSYVLLAACSDTESAIEATLDGTRYFGVLTDALVEAAGALGRNQPWKTLYDRVLARVQSRFPSQTPQMLGQLDRQAFGVSLLPVEKTFPVMEVDRQARRLTLGGGRALGIVEGAELGVFAPGATDFTVPKARVATATDKSVDGARCRATIGINDNVSAIQPGAPAILLRRPQRTGVGFFRRGEAPPEVEQAALARIEESILTELGGILEVTGQGVAADLQVAVNVSGQYEICDAKGDALPYVSPFPCDADGASACVIDRLRRLAHYQMVRDTVSAPTSLDATVTTEIRTAPNGPPLVFDGRQLEVVSGTKLYLRVHNAGPNPIHVAWLDLQCDWGISMLAPAGGVAANEVVGPGETKRSVITMEVPPGFDETPDVLAMFASEGHVDYRLLTQEALDVRELAVRGAPIGKDEKWLVRHFRLLVTKRAPG